MVRVQDFSLVDCFFLQEQGEEQFDLDPEGFQSEKGGEASGNEHLEDNPCCAAVDVGVGGWDAEVGYHCHHRSSEGEFISWVLHRLLV